MVLVELVRLVIVLALTAAGYQIGERLPQWLEPAAGAPGPAILISSVVGAGLGYVLGGVLGRGLLTAIGAVERSVERVSGAELVTGAIGFFSGAVAAAFLSWPILAFISNPAIAYPVVALLFIVLGATGYRIAARKRFDMLGMMGLAQSRTFRAPVEHTIFGPKVLDTSAIIDGRVVDVARAGFFAGHVICPRFVLAELQAIADSPDPTRGARGRRGLEVLDLLQGESRIQLEVADDAVPEAADVDSKLVAYTKRMQGVLVTNDFNLHKTAELQGVPVLNMNNLAAALKPVVLPGEPVSVRIIRGGSQAGQGIGYLDDGTMVVVEGARAMQGREVEAVVTSVLQTSAGRMIFSKPAEPAPASGE